MKLTTTELSLLAFYFSLRSDNVGGPVLPRCYSLSFTYILRLAHACVLRTLRAGLVIDRRDGSIADFTEERRSHLMYFKERWMCMLRFVTVRRRSISSSKAR